MVYDLTSFEVLHPGGPKILKAFYGKDASKAFHGGVHAHTIVATSMLSQYQIGRVVEPDVAHVVS
jgi:stearoyl-CoA desaturase (delta-9 desaturase)